MSYLIPDILNWAKISQPLARYGEEKKKGQYGASVDEDLDIKIYNTRLDVAYAYAQDPASANTYQQANYLLTLLGIYLFEAQQTTGGGGSISPVIPITNVDPYNFYVDPATSFIITGQISKIITSFIGFNLIFNRNSIVQSTLTSEPTYYTWNKTTGLFTCSPAAITSELFQLIPA